MEEQVMDTPIESQDTGDTELYDVDDIATAFGADEVEGDSDADGGSAEQPSEPESPAGETEGEGQAENPEPVVEIPQPEGWEEAMWKGLTPEVQNHINSRIQEHAKALAAAEQAQVELRAKQEEYTIKTNSEMQQALTTMKQVIEGEYGQINWQELAQNDPASYVRLQQMYGARMQAIQQIQRNITAQAQAYQQERAQAEQKALNNEYNVVLPEIKAMIGSSFNSKSYAAEIANYMVGQGVPREVVNNVSKGYELKFVTKAMLYDKMMAQRAAAAQKVAQAPKVTAPAGQTMAEANSGKRGKALANLNNHPDSVDALTALFEVL